MQRIDFGYYDKETTNRVFGMPNSTGNRDLPLVWENCSATINGQKFFYNAKSTNPDQNNQVYVELYVADFYTEEETVQGINDVFMEMAIAEHDVVGTRNGEFGP